MLRTYAQYLGLKPDRVLSVYAKHADEVEPPEPPGKLGRVERGLAASRIRDNQKFLLIAAAVVLVALMGWGWCRAAARRRRRRSRHRRSAACGASSTPASGVDVTVVATAPVEVAAVIDGASQAPTTLRPGESIALMATGELSVAATTAARSGDGRRSRRRRARTQVARPWTATYTRRERG